MAGKPRFFRAKRLINFHTSHKTIFEGSETQHVKSNLVASVDGNHKVKADVHHVTPRASFDSSVAIKGALAVTGALAVGGKITGADNVVRSVKRTVAYSEFTATNRKFPQSIELYRASPGDTVSNVVANVTTYFGMASLMGTGINAVSRLHVSVGQFGATGGFKTTIVPATETGWRWMMDGNSTGASFGTYLKSITGSLLTKGYLTATSIQANFRASENYLASLGQGSMDFYIDVMSRS